MAGGEGTRLRPITSTRPKPMVNLCGRPVLEEILRLLKKNNISDACITLKYMPEHITGYFGSGERLGMRIESRIEETPLGTAGGVKACEDFIGGDCFIVISGDSVCDFDLTKCIRHHNESGAEATLVLYEHPNPLEYGVVVTGADGRIEQFIEKPPWDRVVTNLINTGIYILSPSVLADIPADKPFDFSKDLFPKLLREGRKLYGVVAEGYWCDIGSPGEYLRCTADMLEGKIGFAPGAKTVRHGVWSDSTTDGGMNINAPVYIGKNVTIHPSAKIGPNTVIASGSTVGAGAVIKNSIIDSAHIHDNARITGAYIGARASIGEGCEVMEGCVIGDESVLAPACRVSENVRIWPKKQIPAGTNVTASLSSGMVRETLAFGDRGSIRGEFNVTLTPEMCFAIGSAAAELAGKVGIMWHGRDGAKCAALSMMCGVMSAGGSGVMLDAEFSACASFASESAGVPMSALISERERDIEIEFFAEDGLHITRSDERKLESAVNVDFPRAGVQNVGSSINVSGIIETYVRAAAKGASLSGLKAAVDGHGAANRAVRSALNAAGCEIVAPRRGIPIFTAGRDGFLLSAVDESGRELDTEKMFMLAALSELERGAKRLAAPYSAPFILEDLAAGYGAEILRLESGGGARELYSAQRFLWDSTFAVVRICALMKLTGSTLAELADTLPSYAKMERELAVSHGRASVMRSILSDCAEMAEDFTSGLRITTDKGFVHVAPCKNREAIRILGEGADMEAATELCASFEELAKKADSK